MLPYLGDIVGVGLKPDGFVTRGDLVTYFAGTQVVGEPQVGVGDEILLVSRLVNHEGNNVNTPIANFGNISALPVEPTKVSHAGRTWDQEIFVVETRIRSRFSGSPVFWCPSFVYIPEGKTYQEL